jgi:hypothetical protein
MESFLEEEQRIHVLGILPIALAIRLYDSITYSSSWSSLFVVKSKVTINKRANP